MHKRIRSPWYSNISGRFWKVWRRDLDVYLKTWTVNLVLPFLEPVLYLVAMGFGFGNLVPGGVEGVPYILFIAPAVVAIAVMNSAFFETTYGSFVRMTYQKTFDAITATPLTLEEVITGEMVFAAFKGMVYGTIVLVMVTGLGLLGLVPLFASANAVFLLLIIPFSLLFGLLSSALGMCCTAIAPNIDSFNYATFFLITPMFLFSGTFFPITILPGALQALVLTIFPLTHGVIVMRQLMVNMIDLSQMLISLAWIGIVTFVLLVLAIIAMNRKLIK
ncbi:MAG: ABC transporter permease [Candidatus Atabeyarchaeum deiterrae]